VICAVLNSVTYIALTLCIKLGSFYINIRYFSEISAKASKSVLSRSVEESSKTFLDPDPDSDDFQNLVSSSWSKDTFLVSFHEDPIGSFYV